MIPAYIEHGVQVPERPEIAMFKRVSVCFIFEYTINYGSLLIFCKKNIPLFNLMSVCDIVIDRKLFWRFRSFE